MAGRRGMPKRGPCRGVSSQGAKGQRPHSAPVKGRGFSLVQSLSV